MNWRERYIRTIFIGQIDALESVGIDRILAGFSTAEAEALEVANDAFARMGGEPSDGGDADMADIAEIANDEGLAHYEMLKSVEQAIINLLAAAMYHLYEQQKAHLVRILRRTGGPVIDFDDQPGKTKIDEANLVANATKHGGNAQDLKKIRPDLFAPPGIASVGSAPTSNAAAKLTEPLGGQSLFVQIQDIRDYAAAIRQRWQAVAQLV
jgi:hypothetical protein